MAAGAASALSVTQSCSGFVGVARAEPARPPPSPARPVVLLPFSFSGLGTFVHSVGLSLPLGPASLMVTSAQPAGCLDSSAGSELCAGQWRLPPAAPFAVAVALRDRGGCGVINPLSDLFLI